MAAYLPLISICTHARNRLSHLKQALDTIVAQDYDNIEVIVVDYDCSEGSYAEIKQNYRDPRIKVYKHSDREKPWSRAVAKNAAVSHARGEWVVVLDCDNLLHRHFISQHLALLAKLKNGFLFGGACTQTTKAKRVPYGLTIVKREDFLSVDGFNEALNHGWGWEDDELALRLIDNGLRCSPLLGYVTDIKHSDCLRNRVGSAAHTDISLMLNELQAHLELRGLSEKRKFNRHFAHQLSVQLGVSSESIIAVKSPHVLFSNRSMNHAFPFKKIKTFYTCTIEAVSPGGTKKSVPLYLIADLSLFYHCYYLFVDRIDQVTLYNPMAPAEKKTFYWELVEHQKNCLAVTSPLTYKAMNKFARSTVNEFLNDTQCLNHRTLAEQFVEFAQSKKNTLPLSRQDKLKNAIARERHLYNTFKENFTWKQLDYPRHYIFWVTRLYLSGFELVKAKPQHWIESGSVIAD